MSKRKPLTWPPKVGARFCLDYGAANLNNYTAEVRAIVDDDYAVVRRWRPRKGWHTYEILSRMTVEVFNESKPVFWLGSMPKRSVT